MIKPVNKTLALRGLVQQLLEELPGQTYYRRAPTSTGTPFKTFDLSRVDLMDATRDDFDLCVDVYDRSIDPKQVDEIGDRLESRLSGANLPQNTILPTFFRSSRYPVQEENRNLQHLQLHFTVQLYTLEEE